MIEVVPMTAMFSEFRMFTVNKGLCKHGRVAEVKADLAPSELNFAVLCLLFTSDLLLRRS